MTKVTIDRALIEQAVELLDKGVCDFWSQYDDKAEGIIQELRAGLAEPAVEPETVSVFGVKPNGEVVDTGVKAQMPPRMKAKDLVNEMYGRTWEQDDGSESDLCFAVCEEFFEWLIAQGWKASPPPPAEPARTSQDVCTVPLLSDEEIDAIPFRALDVGPEASFKEFARAIEQLVRRKAGL